jgi:hypothetical protein
MEDNYDEEAAFFQQLVDGHELEGIALGITKLVIDKGQQSLSPAQKRIFDTQVLAIFVTNECKRGGHDVPWSEMYEAYSNGGYCSYCQHMKDELDNQ